ncbi:MAG: 4Fe-4S cluster-binding domain-containing protein [Actinobacteria bacterium]|nr:4Fe-4S cluster-binding domain-containing protein [Actinomycetota bacterium]
MGKLYPRLPVSTGLLLSYRCNIKCDHCIYACSPKWKNSWISEADAKTILTQLSTIFSKTCTLRMPYVSFNYGLHLTGGEPFLNFKLLVRITEIAKELDIPSILVETNCFWAREDESASKKIIKLREAGLDGILISINPFNVKYIPFERLERAVRISREIFGINAIVYQEFFFNVLKEIKLENKITYDEYLIKIQKSNIYRYIELLPMGRAAYALKHLYNKYPASYFFSESCKEELTRGWHTHIDNYCNYIPGFCAGISLGDARSLQSIFEGIDLEQRPILKALSNKIEDLYEIGKYFGYKDNAQGYVSKCHLCLDIRRYLVKKTEEFYELNPKEYYLNFS